MLCFCFVFVFYILNKIELSNMSADNWLNVCQVCLLAEQCHSFQAIHAWLKRNMKNNKKCFLHYSSASLQHHYWIWSIISVVWFLHERLLWASNLANQMHADRATNASHLWANDSFQSNLFSYNTQSIFYPWRNYSYELVLCSESRHIQHNQCIIKPWTSNLVWSYDVGYNICEKCNCPLYFIV